jgi:hypothetical protein
MIKALVVNDGEGRRLFGMEWAQTGETAPFADKLHPFADQIGQRHALAQILDEFRRYGHSLSDSQ